MPRESMSGKAPVPRIALTRDRIIDTAVILIEREGEQGASMRRIAAELGVAAMSLYNHVPSKSALLEGIAGRIVGELAVSDDPDLPWQERARASMQAYRALARRHPRCLSFVLRHSGDTPAGLRPIEGALALAADAGFKGEVAVSIMRALLAYAIGSQIRESGPFRTTSLTIDDGAGPINPDDYPNLIAALPHILRGDDDRDFDFGLDLLLAAIDGLPREPNAYLRP